MAVNGISETVPRCESMFAVLMAGFAVVAVLTNFIAASYLFELLMAASDTPLIYLGVWWVRRDAVVGEAPVEARV